MKSLILSSETASIECILDCYSCILYWIQAPSATVNSMNLAALFPDGITFDGYALQDTNSCPLLPRHLEDQVNIQLKM